MADESSERQNVGALDQQLGNLGIDDEKKPELDSGTDVEPRDFSSENAQEETSEYNGPDVEPAHKLHSDDEPLPAPAAVQEGGGDDYDVGSGDAENPTATQVDDEPRFEDASATDDSTATTTSEATTEEQPPKKEGFFAKLKEKVTFHHHPKHAEEGTNTA